MKTYIINEKRQAGGNYYREYTWSEVLNYFRAPEDISDVDELEEWYEKETGIQFDYNVEQWRDENGEIISKLRK